ncbi:MAG: hypothetical protein IJN54_12915 [Lachnospiraceae bacterium]|nr:hypothetical protein [Lachnospiraceae bacterium]
MVVEFVIEEFTGERTEETYKITFFQESEKEMKLFNKVLVENMLIKFRIVV